METPQYINLNNKIINFSPQTKFLGLYIDEFLNWSYQIEHLCKKLNQVSYFIRVLSTYVEKNTLKTVYFACFQSLLRYGIIFWGRCTTVERVFTIQKRMVRVLCNKKYKDTCRGLFKSNELLTVAGIYIYELLIFMFKNRTKFEYLKSKSSRSLDYIYPRHRLMSYEKSCFYSCIKCFNKLPYSIKSLNTFSLFKKRVFEYLLSIEPYTFNEFLLH